MPSTLAWLSHSETERQRALDALELFQHKGARDELGIGQIRDAFSELLFPGTSTVQTRAGYFLFVPWIYLDLERRKIRSAHIGERARRAEVRLVNALARSDDPEGTIGIDARGSLKRLPSAVYWGGLGTWGIRRFRGHRGQYHRSLDSYYRSLDRFGRSEIEESEELAPRNWHAGVPSPPKSFPDHASFSLRAQDAAYLQERIFLTDRSSLLAYLVEEPGHPTMTRFPWEHPVLARVPERVRRTVDHARNFSEVIHGAPLLYNLMMAETASARGLQSEERVEDFRDRLAGWIERVSSRLRQLRDWDRRELWAVLQEAPGNVPPPTHRFVTEWLDLVLKAPGPARIRESPRARDLISHREQVLKRSRARLHHPRALELWGGDSGSGQLDYRWPVVREIVRDIVDGLARGDK